MCAINYEFVFIERILILVAVLLWHSHSCESQILAYECSVQGTPVPVW
jgi:hypothetical protein